MGTCWAGYSELQLEETREILTDRTSLIYSRAKHRVVVNRIEHWTLVVGTDTGKLTKSVRYVSAKR